jgi:hypothetical protein
MSSWTKFSWTPRLVGSFQVAPQALVTCCIGNKSDSEPSKPYSNFDKTELEAKIVIRLLFLYILALKVCQAKVQSEVSVLQQKAAERDAAKSRANAENTNFSLSTTTSESVPAS